MSKQTTVEWLEQEFIALQNYGVNELGLFAKAKEIEKQQIIDAYKLGVEDGLYIKRVRTGEEYYNKTFKD